MKTIVIYTSKTGYTRQYAEMLANALDCQVISRMHLFRINLGDFDRIIYGGGIRASKVSGLKTMLPRLKKLTGKRIIIFSVGATGMSNDYTIDLRKKNLDDNHVDFPFFYFQGGFDPDRLSFFMRFMLRNVEKSIRKKEAKAPGSLDQGDKDFLDFFRTPHMNVSEDNLNELIAYINGLEQ